jgi:hypothetical protein
VGEDAGGHEEELEEEHAAHATNAANAAQCAVHGEPRFVDVCRTGMVLENADLLLPPCVPFTLFTSFRK